MKNYRRLFAPILLLAVGVTLIVLSAAGKVDSTLWSGVGGALCAANVAALVCAVRCLTDEAYRKKSEIAVTDERNRYLRLKAWAWAGYLTTVCAALAAAAALIVGARETAAILGLCVCFPLNVFWISHLILQRRN